MNVSIELNDRQYRDIENYCNANELDIQEYIVGIINEKHSINKFGDLNDIIPKVIEENTVSVKKRGRPKKVVVEQEEHKTEEKQTNTESAVIEKATEEVKTEIELKNNEELKVTKPTVKRKRTLKTL